MERGGHIEDSQVEDDEECVDLREEEHQLRGERAEHRENKELGGHCQYS